MNEMIVTEQKMPVFAGVAGNVNEETMQEMLSRAIGHYVNVEMMMGNQVIKKEGVLLQVGQDYYVLFDRTDNTVMTCELKSLKIMKIFRTANRNMQPAIADRTDNVPKNAFEQKRETDMHDRMYNMQLGCNQKPDYRMR